MTHHEPVNIFIAACAGVMAKQSGGGGGNGGDGETGGEIKQGRSERSKIFVSAQISAETAEIFDRSGGPDFDISSS